MIGSIIQYGLYALLSVTVALAISGLFLAMYARKGRDVHMMTQVAGLSLIAGIAPYVGLFGTVWHIIQALSGIGSGNLSVAAIAQPIGEALYATLWGLGCAILAMVAHRFILAILPDDELDQAAGEFQAAAIEAAELSPREATGAAERTSV